MENKYDTLNVTFEGKRSPLPYIEDPISQDLELARTFCREGDANPNTHSPSFPMTLSQTMNFSPSLVRRNWTGMAFNSFLVLRSMFKWAFGFLFEES